MLNIFSFTQLARYFLTILSGFLTEIFVLGSNKLKDCLSKILTFAVINQSDLLVCHI